ncbi:MAG TPA: hypothetical protein QF361_10380 [Gammaproteobacteria bacterium]|nr:hypothetical protein [Gammaproteobacteria bacterium]
MQIGVETLTSVENHRVFVLESEDITRTALQFMLHDAYETHEFSDPLRALARAHDWPPDLLLLGPALLAMRGRTLLSELALTLPRTRLLLVGDPAAPVIEQALQAGTACSVITLPLRLEAVRAAVDAALARTQALPPAS